MSIWNLTNVALAVLVLLGAAVFAAIETLLILRLRGTLADLLYVGISSPSGGDRGVSFGGILLFLVVLELAVLGAAALLARLTALRFE